MRRFWPILFLLLTICLPFDPDRYQWQILGGTIAFILFFSLYLAKKTHLFAGLLFGYCAISACLISLCPRFPWYQMDELTVSLFRAASTQTLLFMLCVTLIALFTPNGLIRSWLDGFVIIGIISCVVIVWRAIHNYDLIFGVFSNSAEDATYLGLIQPYMWTQKRWKPWVFLTGTCILRAHSSTGFAILALQVFLLGLSKFKTRIYAYTYTIGAALSVPLIGHFILGDKFLNNDGRFQVWSLTLEVFNKLVNPFTGLGASSFLIAMTQIQFGMKERTIFLWAHNDWLQILFEYGIIGITLTICLYSTMLYKSKNRPWVFVTLLSMAIGAFLQMPLRLMLTSLFYAFMCRISLGGDTKRSCLKSNLSGVPRQYSK